MHDIRDDLRSPLQEEEVTDKRVGYSVKLTNIFSKDFMVEIA
jgi:hypothetical protein